MDFKLDFSEPNELCAFLQILAESYPRSPSRETKKSSLCMRISQQVLRLAQELGLAGGQNTIRIPVISPVSWVIEEEPIRFDLPLVQEFPISKRILRDPVARESAWAGPLESLAEYYLQQNSKTRDARA